MKRWLGGWVALVAILAAGAAPARTTAAAPQIRILPAVIPQGGSAEIVVIGLAAPDAQVRFAGRIWPLIESGGVWRAFLGTDPLTTPGLRVVVVEASGTAGTVRAGQAALTVRRVAFRKRRITFSPERRDLLDPKLAAEEARKVAAALRTLSRVKLWQGPFRVPVRGAISSPYGVVSLYQGRVSGFHRGVDLAAAAATPVAASHDGIVRLAEYLPLSGNAVLIDHGMGIVTSYLHQSALLVRRGQRVRRGQIIGRVGSTGLSTGPHLHWGFRVNGVHVDPMPWTAPGRP